MPPHGSANPFDEGGEPGSRGTPCAMCPYSQYSAEQETWLEVGPWQAAGEML